ncbi:sugar transferase [Planctomycetota bacterium]
MQMEFYRSKPSLYSRFFATLVDLAMVNIALILGIWLHGLRQPLGAHWIPLQRLAYGISFGDTQLLIPYTILIPCAVFWVTGSYNVRLSKVNMEAFYPVVHGNLISFVVLALFVHFYRGDPEINRFPTTALLAAPIISLAGTLTWRLTLRSVIRMQDIAFAQQINLLIIGLSGFDEETYKRITRNDYPNYNIVGFLEGQERGEFEFSEDIRKLGRLEEMAAIIDDKHVEEVLVMPSALDYSEFLKVVEICELRHLDYRIVPSYFDMVASRAQVDLVNYVPLIYFGQPTITGWQAFVKRAFDIVFCGLALLIFSPIFLLLCILIVLDSPGMPLFTQNRVGKGGDLFRLFKFRTMYTGSEHKGALTVEDDPRITKMGKFLRRWSFDELPQLLNVFKGEMSLVGPRAVVPYVVKKFNNLERMTLNILPGITGLAQVSGRDAVSFRDKSMLNIYYIRNYSILLDLKIVFRTFKTIVTSEGNL